MRNMSYALTTRQFLEGTKDVTRRLGWCDLQPGDLIQGVLKGMGLPKGERIQRLRIIRVAAVRREPLRRMIDDPDYGREEARREGFPELDGQGFVRMFCRRPATTPESVITRIQFQHIPGGRESDIVTSDHQFRASVRVTPRGIEWNPTPEFEGEQTVISPCVPAIAGTDSTDEPDLGRWESDGGAAPSEDGQ